MQLVDRHTCKGGSAKVAQLIDNFPILCENVHYVWGVACFLSVELCPEAVVKVLHHKPLSVLPSVQGPPIKSALFMRY